VSFLSQLFGGQAKGRAALRPLYDAVVRIARQPDWYRAGGVPDTIDGRFEMVASVLTLVLLRLEAEAERTRRETVVLTELFIDDMDGSLRQLGIGDLVVGKQVGKLMGVLGGRLGAFRAGLADGDLAGPVRRNIFREAPPSEDAVRFVADRLEQLAARLRAIPLAPLLVGEIRA
jgi:cytochrome b pre-mRNA-processing protein 3